MMGRLRTLTGVMIVFLLFNTFNATHAQASDSPLLDLLSRVPTDVQGDIDYVDLAAIEQAYPPARMPEDWEAFSTRSSAPIDQRFPIDVWESVFSASENPLSRLIYYGDDMPAQVGYDLFQIDRALVAGALPTYQTIHLQGSFDTDAVGAALTGRELSAQSTVGEFELWCRNDGCDQSNQADSLASQAEVFGGERGQRWARLVSPGLIIGSSNHDTLEQVADIVNGDEPGVGDALAVQALVTSVSDQGVLLQAFLPGSVFWTISSLIPFNPDIFQTEDRQADIRELLDAGYETLPIFRLTMFSSLVTETEQIAQLAFLYTTADDAEIAARVIPARLQSWRSDFYNQQVSVILERLRISRIDTEVVKIGDYYVMRLSLATPKATPEQIVEFGNSLVDPETTRPGSLFGFIMNQYRTSDLGWLNLNPREALEDYAGG